MKDKRFFGSQSGNWIRCSAPYHQACHGRIRRRQFGLDREKKMQEGTRATVRAINYNSAACQSAQGSKAASSASESDCWRRWEVNFGIVYGVVQVMTIIGSKDFSGEIRDPL